MSASPEDSPEPEKKPKTWSLIKRLWPELRPHLRYVWGILIAMLLATPLALASPLIIRLVIDDAIGGERSQLLDWGLILLAMTLGSVILGLLSGYCSTLFHTKVIYDLRKKLYLHVQRLSLSYYRDKETGYLMSRQVDDVGNLAGVMADAFGKAAIESLRAVAYMGMLFYVEWRMALGGVVLALMIFGFEYAISGQLRRRSREARERWTEVSEALHQSVTGHYLVQSTASERREARRFSGVLHKSVRAGVSRDLFSLWTNHIFHLIAGVAPTLIILAGVYLIVSSDFTVGGLFAFFMYLVQMFGAVGAVAGLNPAMQSSLASLERIFEVLDVEPEIREPECGRRLEHAGALRFEDVSFSYDEKRPVLQGIDLDLPPQSSVALVGPSGAGKTTLAQLVPRFYDPSEGRILADGIDLRELDLRSFRRQVGIVPQEVFLFDRSVAENIAYGRPGADLSEIREAARAANALDFIEAMDEGFDTMIGERGVKLSGGQRQRLAIARELLRDPAILILDEATSSLDSESEALIQEALATLLAGRSSIVIAHRLSTVIRADQILVLDQGSIVERGRHEELLAKEGLYARLFHSQFSRPFADDA